MRRALVAPWPSTRLILRSSSMRCAWVGRRPAVSASTTSMPRARRRADRVEHDRGGVAARLLDRPRRRCARPRPRAARAPRRGRCRRRPAARVRPCCCSHLASLPMDVVLPAPFTPASMITKGRCGADDERLLERREEVGQRIAQHGARVRVGAGAAASARAGRRADAAARRDADVGVEQGALRAPRAPRRRACGGGTRRSARRRASRATGRGPP